MASANPFVQRTRNERFSTMFAAYLAGSVLGGAATGAVLALLGRLAFDGIDARARLVVVVVLAVVGAVLDRTPVSAHLRGWVRQVPERWRYRYRAPVWGFGYGLQLGAAFTTIVASSATWVAFAAALLSTDVRGGLVIGAVFGAARAATLLPARAATSPESLRTVMAAHARAAGRVTAGVTAGGVVAVLAATTWVVFG